MGMLVNEKLNSVNVDGWTKYIQYTEKLVTRIFEYIRADRIELKANGYMLGYGYYKRIV